MGDCGNYSAETSIYVDCLRRKNDKDEWLKKNYKVIVKEKIDDLKSFKFSKEKEISFESEESEIYGEDNYEDYLDFQAKMIEIHDEENPRGYSFDEYLSKINFTYEKILSEEENQQYSFSVINKLMEFYKEDIYINNDGKSFISSLECSEYIYYDNDNSSSSYLETNELPDISASRLSITIDANGNSSM